MRKYYSLAAGETVADLYIYGDIVSASQHEGEAGAFGIAEEIEALPETVTRINCYINSYGGEVAAGMAIHNLLARHKATVTTYCDGFACSAASLVFMAGDERIMNEASMLVIHNAWALTVGNAAELRKEADDLDKLSKTAANAYRAKVNLPDDELDALLNAESWISPTEALRWGFATSVVAVRQTAQASMNVRKSLFDKIAAASARPAQIPPPEPEPIKHTFFNFRR